MDGVEKTALLKEVKKRYKIELHPNTFDSCEKAAKSIAKKFHGQKRTTDSHGDRSSAEADTKFRAKLITDAANTISNQNGGTQADVSLFLAAVVIVIIAFLIKLGIDHFYGMDSKVGPGIEGFNVKPE